MPHTGPKSPMNGVVLAVVARKVSIRSSLPTCSFAARLSARSTLLHPRHFRGENARILISFPRARFQHLLGFLIARGEHLAHRTALVLGEFRVQPVEALGAPKRIDEFRRAPPRSPKLPKLPDDDGPGREREKNEHEQNEKHHAARLGGEGR